MSTLSVVRIGHPVLREKCALLDKKVLSEAKFKNFMRQMVATMHKEEGVGLAANQVGVGIMAVALECRESRRYPGKDDFPLELWINPKILRYSDEKIEDWEGCLSIPGYRGLVPRSKWIEVEAINMQGKKMKRRLSGFHARVMQHEVDHINGYFYIDRMKGMQTFCHLDEFGRKI